MFGQMVRVTRKLWTIVQTAAVTDETVLGFTEPNPRHIAFYYTAGIINFKVTAKNNLTLTNIGITGALGPAQATSPGGGFPNVAAGYELLAYTESNIGVGDGIVRPIQVPSRDNSVTVGNTDHNRLLCPVIPNFLLCKYTTAAPGAGPTITIEVWATLVGLMLHGTD